MSPIPTQRLGQDLQVVYPKAEPGIVRGNVVNADHTDRLPVPSIGPRLEGRGNWIRKVAWAACFIVLQLGNGSKAVEMSSTTS